MTERRPRGRRERWPVLYAAATAALLVVQGTRRETLGALDVAALVLLAAPLAGQLRHPRASALAIAVLMVPVSAWVLDLTDVTAMFALTIAPAFQAGRLAPPSRGWVVLPALLAGIVLTDLVNPGLDPGIALGFVFFVLPAWGIGRAIGSRTALVADLARVNAELEEEQRAREASAAAAERARIARELHDVVAHAVSVMVLQAAGARLAVARAPAVSVAALEVVEAAGHEAVAEMRRLLGVLRDEDPGGPAAGLAHLGALVTRAREAGLALEVDVDPRTHGLAPTLDLAAYRIVQEALTNAVKHAAPARARLHVCLGEGTLDLLVEDDGRLVAPGPGTGHGLLGLRERVALHGGTLDAAARDDGGFRVHARLPLA